MNTPIKLISRGSEYCRNTYKLQAPQGTPNKELVAFITGSGLDFVSFGYAVRWEDQDLVRVEIYTD